MLKLMSASACIGIIYGVFNFVLIPYLTAKTSSASLAGNLVSAGMFLTIFTGLFIGYKSDKNKNYLMFIKMLLISSIISMGMLSLNGTVLLSILSIIFVTSIFSLLSPFSALVSNVSVTAEKDRNYGLIMGAMNGATFISSLFIGYIARSGTEMVFLVFSVLAFILMLPVFKFNEKNNILEKPRQPEKFRITKKVLLVMASQFGTWFSIGGILPFLTLFISTQMSFDIADASLIMGISTLISAVISFLTGFLCRFTGRRSLYIISLLLMSLLFLFMFAFYELFISAGILVWITALMILSFSVGIIYALNVSIVSDTATSENQGKIFAVNSIVMVVSESLSLSILGNIISAGFYRSIFLTVFLGFLFSLLFYFFLILRERRDRIV